MIAASIFLGAALYFSAVTIMGMVKAARGLRSNPTASAFVASLEWALFYWATHAA